MIKVKGFEYRLTVYGYQNARKQGVMIEKSENRLVTIYTGKKDKSGFPYYIFIKKLDK